MKIKISLHNNYVLRHYAELYEYLNYEILNGSLYTKNLHQRKLPAIRYVRVGGRRVV